MPISRQLFLELVSNGVEVCVDTSIRARRGSFFYEWGQERREAYLLRSSIVEPLSADPKVWPYESNGVEVALAIVAETVRGDSREVDNWCLAARPMPSSVTVLGYDVADGWWTSGLMGCRYSTKERYVLGNQWAEKLNEHHLFESVKDALAFRNIADVRVREHAPFYVYGVYA